MHAVGAGGVQAAGAAGTSGPQAHVGAGDVHAGVADGGSKGHGAGSYQQQGYMQMTRGAAATTHMHMQ